MRLEMLLRKERRRRRRRRKKGILKRETAVKARDPLRILSASCGFLANPRQNKKPRIPSHTTMNPMNSMNLIYDYSQRRPAASAWIHK